MSSPVARPDSRRPAGEFRRFGKQSPETGMAGIVEGVKDATANARRDELVTLDVAELDNEIKGNSRNRLSPAIHMQ